MVKTAGMPFYIEKMVEFLDQQGIEGADAGPGSRMRGSGSGFGSRSAGPVNFMLHNISLQQVGAISERVDVRVPLLAGQHMRAYHQGWMCTYH